MAESPGRRLGRRQAREGIERIAEPRHGTATRGADEPRQAAGSGLMGVRMGYGDIDLWALGSRGVRDRTGADADLQAHVAAMHTDEQEFVAEAEPWDEDSVNQARHALRATRATVPHVPELFRVRGVG